MVRLFYTLLMSKEIELPADYYLDNFLKLIRHSVEWYEPLLKSKERKWINKFICLKKMSNVFLLDCYLVKAVGFVPTS